MRWRWHADNQLEVRASHRMTNDRWYVLDVDGSRTALFVPSEFMVMSPDATPEEEARIRDEYQQSWSDYARALEAARMDDVEPSAPPTGTGPGEQQWWLDGE